VHVSRALRGIRAQVTGRVRQDQIAAGRQRIPEGGNDARGVLRVSDEVQGRHQQQGDRLAEVDQRASLRMSQDDFRFPQVSHHDTRCAAPVSSAFTCTCTIGPFQIGLCARMPGGQVA